MWCIRVVDNNYYLANWAEQTQLISNEKKKIIWNWQTQFSNIKYIVNLMYDY